VQLPEQVGTVDDLLAQRDDLRDADPAEPLMPSTPAHRWPPMAMPGFAERSEPIAQRALADAELAGRLGAASAARVERLHDRARLGDQHDLRQLGARSGFAGLGHAGLLGGASAPTRRSLRSNTMCSGRISGCPAPRINARRMTFSSSRILPGQPCTRSIASAASLIHGAGAAVGRMAQQQREGERGDVRRPLAQRDEAHRENVEAIIEVGAEAAFLDLERQVAVGRGDDPHVDLDRPGRADRDHLAFLQRAQQLGLQPSGISAISSSSSVPPSARGRSPRGPPVAR
jgi:hypothetical protein